MGRRERRRAGAPRPRLDRRAGLDREDLRRAVDEERTHKGRCQNHPALLLAMRFRQELRPGYVKEEAHEETEQRAERRTFDPDGEGGKSTDDGGRSIDEQPPERGRAWGTVREEHADRPDAVGVVMQDNHDRDEQAKLDPGVERCADRETIHEAVHAHAARAEGANVLMAIDGHASLMAHVYQRDSPEEIEDKKAERCENDRALERAHLFRALRADGGA